MLSTRRIEACVARGFVLAIASALTLTACAAGGMSGQPYESSSPVAVASSDAATSGAASSETVPEGELTATEAAIRNAPASSAAAPQPDLSSAIRSDAPMTYTVKRGDTLWDIASLFLKDPWLWPEVWYINPQVRNPHLIYPGDTLALAKGADGKPQIRLVSGGAARLTPRLRSSPIEGAIPTLPYSAVAAFLSRPTVLAKEQIARAPHVLAFREKHMIGGSGNEIYVRGLDAPENARFSVIHIGDALRDPDDGDIVGYEGIYTATASVIATSHPAKAILSDSARETLIGDRLIAADNDPPLNFELSAAPQGVNGRIIAVIDGTELIGQYQIVVINRGTRHGLAPGNILAIDQAGEVVRDRYGGHALGVNLGFGDRVQLPPERAGTLLVFRSFDRISYGLVVGASSEMHVGDFVRAP